MSVERRGTKALELWARRVTDGYNGVTISNMTTDWRNGLAFCALIHRFRPDLIDFSSLKPENILENNALAFRVAEQQLGIPALLDAEDMVECETPDRLSVLTYVSQFYQVFASLGLTSPKRVVNNVSPPPSSPAGVKKTKLTTPIPPQPQPKTKTEIKTDKVLVGGRLRREVCVRCSNPVFLAERLLVGSPGQLMHRTCFRCARCTTQLTLASYYETEKGQFCCETCPDEELNISPEDTNSILSSTSPKPARRTSTSDSESDSEYESEGSENESDSYSNTVELVLEDKIQKDDDTRSVSSTHSPKVTPGPPKPRTVFLANTLMGDSPKSSSDEHKAAEIVVSKEEQKFSQVSPALFGSREKDARATTKASDDSGLDHCDDAKGLITDPPDKLTLDTGQGKRSDRVSDSAIETSSSIVAQRLKMFREISNKTNSTSNLKTNLTFNKKDPKEKDETLQNLEKESSLQFKASDTKLYTNKENSRLPVKDDDSVKLEVTVSYSYNEKKDKLLSEEILRKDEVDSKPDEKIPLEKTEAESKEKDAEFVPAIPSITISNEKEEAKVSESEAEGTEALLDKTPVVDVTVKEQQENTEGSGTESNPFDAEDESQLEESGVAVTQSPEGGSDNDNNNNNTTTSISQDSGAELSTASLRSVQYPEDLNPFGSDNDDDEMEGTTSIGESAATERSETESKKDEQPAKKLIKVNLNPFESDEDEDLNEEKESKSDEKSESKNLNPFWSDDEEPVESTNSTPSKSKVKPPRPPPPTLARNSTPAHMYQNTPDGNQSPRRNTAESRKGSTTMSPARELFPQPQGSPASGQARLSPSLPSAKAHPSPSSPSGSVALRRKNRRAPAPPPGFTTKNDGASSGESTADTLSMDTMSLSSLGTQSLQPSQGNEDEGQDEVLSSKLQKDMKNHTNKMNGTTEQRVPPPKPARAPPQAAMNLTPSKGLARKPSMSKSEAGEWQRKKGPAPPRPVPQKRAIKKMPMRLVQQELQDIEIKQTELERQGVLLETSIRKRTESTSNNPQEDASSLSSSGPSSIEVEDMIMQLFELVNEKNELFRRQTELMYLKREKRLEEEHVEIEYQIRCLMLKPPAEKTEEDTAQENELISRLVKVVEQRDEIINCLELDRLREAQEDESIATHMMQYQEKHIDGIENGCAPESVAKKKKTLKLPRKKKKKEKKDKKGAKADADKDIDETEVKETKKRKKKWLF